MSPPEIPPATLPGTPKSFHIPADKLIETAKQVYKANSGVDDPSLLADNFRFEFPVVSLAKQDYVKAVRSFKLKEAFPNMESHPYDWRVDPYEPQRVWFTIRSTAKHTGPLNFAGATYKATNKEVLGAPECMSFVFDKDGKVSSFTGGYIMDRRVGNTGKLGGLFGVLYAIGAPVPQPGSLSFMLGQLFVKFKNIISGLLGGGKRD
ncbi:hypothetical protein CVIRNUC_010826 [Coccomyxa viridis]|uniref:Uncharacterized protein n=1 Tax=Coccomyxa viridis TaxID=1274662 RepID=A0AAV1IJU5_9CHLO|nr:hypothetical protein CVIRNUC_010826 [Coccomyxa viridis]